MGKGVDRLAGELEQAESRVHELEEQIENEKEERRWRWARHEELPKEQTLPVPRLEIYLAEDDGFNRSWLYRMIYRHLLDHCVAVPMGHTTQGGGQRNLDEMDLMHFLPFRDGAHIRHDAKAFGWPAYIVAGDRVEEIPLEGKL